MMGRTKIAFITAGTVLAVLLTAGYRNINQKLPPAVVEEAKSGEQLEFEDGVLIAVESYRFLTEEEQEQMFAKAGVEPWVGYKSMEVKLTIENTSMENKKLIMTDLNVEGAGMTNGLSKLCIDASEGRYSSPAQELQPGEKKQICFPFDIIKNEIPKREWEKIEEYEMWLTFSSYPIKTKLLLNQEGKSV